MAEINYIFQTLLSFVLELVRIFVGFWLVLARLALDFAQSLIGLVH